MVMLVISIIKSNNHLSRQLCILIHRFEMSLKSLLLKEIKKHGNTKIAKEQSQCMLNIYYPFNPN